MSSLVEQLQAEALDGGVEITTLLRKAYVVSSKLNLVHFKEWCQSELNGYMATPVPEYRVVRGVLKARNPYRGWIPCVFKDEATHELFSTQKLGEGIAAIQHLIESQTEDNQLIIVLGQQAQAFLIESSGLKFEHAIFFSASQLVKVVDTVRNTILEWSLKLEAEGIIGEGMGFNETEREKARRRAKSLQSQINFTYVENMHHSAIQQGSHESTQQLRHGLE